MNGFQTIRQQPRVTCTVSQNCKLGSQQYVPWMLILEHAGCRPNKHSEQPFNVIHNVYVSDSQKKKKKLHPLCHHTTKLCRIKTCWKRSAAKTLCNLSNLPPTFKSQEPWTWDVLLAPVWCIKYIEMWQAVDVWRMIYKLLVRLVIIIIVSVAHFHSEQTALMQ